MNQLFPNFNPIQYLGIELKPDQSPEQVGEITTKLNQQIGEYIMLKLSDSLTEDQLDQILQIEDINQQVALLKNYLPDFEARMTAELENFRKEYQDYA